jgi:small ligand-binding sensory domain FIST
LKWISSISHEKDIGHALTELRRDVRTGLDAPADLLMLFVTPHFESDYGRIPDAIAGALAPALFLGCTGTGIIGAAREVENRPAISVMAASLPGVDITPLYLREEDLPTSDAGPDHWHKALGVAPDPTPHFLLLVDPTGDVPFDPRPLLMGLDFAYPQSAKIGGLASVLRENCLFMGDRQLSGGCAGIALQGNIDVDTVVAQGCRPVGQAMTITECDGCQLTGLDDRGAVEVLVELYHSLLEQDQELLQRSLHLGIASTGLKTDYGAGDFLIRNVLQFDHEKGTISIGDHLEPGQTVQFHIRDPKSAHDELDLLLNLYRDAPSTDPEGALLFTCTGRGRHLFGEDHHDSSLFQSILGDVPLAGMFCGGEIGPVGDSTYLHGYTSSFAIFRPRDGHQAWQARRQALK